MAIRVSFDDSRRSRRLQSYLDGVLSERLPKKGFFGNLMCDVRVRKLNGAPGKNAASYSCAIHVHGNKRLENIVTGRGSRMAEAVRQALRKLDSRLSREHERLITESRRRTEEFRGGPFGPRRPLEPLEA